MERLRIIKGYQEDALLRKSFFELATKTFGLDFETWYQYGFWGNQYIPYSYVDGDKVVANVSVNHLELIIQDKKHRALQIGTVMTRADYRKRGLSARLMNQVLEEYEGKYDFMYLFANESVLDFYPKFGFSEVDEYQFSMDFSSDQVCRSGVHKLDVTNMEELNFLYQFVTERVPVSRKFATGYSQGIMMYHCLNGFNNDIYYVDDVIVIFKKSNNQLDIFDVISKRVVSTEEILTKIADQDIKKIIFHYTPDDEGIQLESRLLKRNGALFVKTNGHNQYPLYVMHPITSEA